MDDLKAHEKECLIRYQNIEQRMNRIEVSVYALYPFLVGSLLAAKFIG